MVGTVENMVNELKNQALIAPGDVKQRRFGISVIVYEDSDAVDSDDNGDGGPAIAEAQTKTPKGFRVPDVPKKRKASSSISIDRERYSSSFRPTKLEPSISYDKYSFVKTEITIDDEGNEQTENSQSSETIEIASNWRSEISDRPNGGYVAKGLTKYAFHGRYNGKRYTIFQVKDIRSNSQENKLDLKGELLLLAYGHYFLNSFKKRAELYTQKLPFDITWNYAGAFLGTVAGFKPPTTTDHCKSLYFDTFLAVPYLDLSSGTERKFSGGTEAGNHGTHDVVGRWMDAYAHHVVEDSSGYLILTDLQGAVFNSARVVLFDPQGHTSLQETGFWDKGTEGIMAEWKRQHKCKTLCRNLGLEPINLPKASKKPNTPTGGPSNLAVILNSSQSPKKAG